MRVSSIHDLAAIVRGRRLDLGMTQENLAQRSGVSRRWVYEFEAGKPTAEIGLVMRVVEGLGLVIELAPGDPTAPSAPGSIDLDDLLDDYRR